MASKELRALLAATIQACGAKWGPETLPVILQDLEVYPEELVAASLQRCRKELRFNLTVADIIERIDDGRPTADEAWAQVRDGLDERRTIVATNEALEALREVRELAATDEIGARMAFRAAYQRIVLRNKAAGLLPQWIPSLGHDPDGREAALQEAAEKGRLEPARVAGLLGSATPCLALPPRSEEDRIAEGRERAGAILAELSGKLQADRQRMRDREPRIDWQAENERLAAQQSEAA